MALTQSDRNQPATSKRYVAHNRIQHKYESNTFRTAMVSSVEVEVEAAVLLKASAAASVLSIPYQYPPSARMNSNGRSFRVGVGSSL